MRKFATCFTDWATRRCLPQGVDCFGAFMQSGLPKEVLKAVWDLVAGDAGQLSRHQFVQVGAQMPREGCDARGGVVMWRTGDLGAPHLCEGGALAEGR